MYIILAIVVVFIIYYVATNHKPIKPTLPQPTAKPEDLLTPEGIPKKTESEQRPSSAPTATNKPAIIKECMRVIEAIQQLGDYDTIDWFFSGVKKRIDTQQDTACRIIKEEQISPKDFMYYQITSQALDLILSGQFCIYRGTLNMEGRELKKLFLHINSEQERLGYITKEVAKDNIVYLNEELQKIG